MIYRRIISFLILFLLCKGLLTAQENQNVMEEIPCTSITIGCRMIKGAEFVITNEGEYQALMDNRSPLNNCPSYELPYIDFNQFTLIGLYKDIGGCRTPEESHTIVKNNFLNTYTFTITIKQKGECAALYHVKAWCLIPKINTLVEQILFEYKSEYEE